MVRSGLGVVFALAAASARAGDPAFGPNDVPTVFFFSKSDDHNRVDYGLRLDDACMPVGAEPLFPYWREFDDGGNGKRTHSLKFFEYAGYGVSDQQIKKAGGKANIKVQLKALPREINITTEKGADGKCAVSARAVIAKNPETELVSCFIKLKTGWTVDYVDVRGKDPKTGAGISERLAP
jgi:hypothetical protein